MGVVSLVLPAPGNNGWMQSRNFCLTRSSSEMTPRLNPRSTSQKGLMAISRVQGIRDGRSHNRRAFPLLCPGYFSVYHSVHIKYHLPNNQQQGCTGSLLVTGRGRRCYDDRSMWEPEWSELAKGRGRLHMVTCWVCLRRSSQAGEGWPSKKTNSSS